MDDFATNKAGRPPNFESDQSSTDSNNNPMNQLINKFSKNLTNVGGDFSEKIPPDQGIDARFLKRESMTLA